VQRALEEKCEMADEDISGQLHNSGIMGDDFSNESKNNLVAACFWYVDKVRSGRERDGSEFGSSRFSTLVFSSRANGGQGGFASDHALLSGRHPRGIVLPGIGKGAYALTSVGEEERGGYTSTTGQVRALPLPSELDLTPMPKESGHSSLYQAMAVLTGLTLAAECMFVGAKGFEQSLRLLATSSPLTIVGAAAPLVLGVALLAGHLFAGERQTEGRQLNG
jgi:hypothetical protein